MKKILAGVSLAVFTLGVSGVVFAEDAAATWDKRCAMCHGKDGKGATKMGEKLKVRDLTDAKVQGEFTDAQLTQAIVEGMADKKMPAFKDKISPDDAKVLVKHIREFKK